MKARVGIEIDVVDSDASGQIDLAAPARGSDAVVRASVHYYSDAAEVEHFVRAVAG